jgi:hypothetical protein
MEIIRQTLDIDEDKGCLTLINTLNNDILCKSNYEERMSVGKALGSTFPTVCSLDPVFLEHEPTGLGKYVLAARSGTPELKIALRQFLEKYPEYKTSDIKI